MRTLGPGSIAALLKTALDVFNALVWAALIALLVVLAVGLLALPFLGSVRGVTALEGRGAALGAALRRWRAALATLAALIVYLNVLLVIVFRLRQVFATLIVGDPFRPQNVSRLRIIGLALIALEGAGYLVRLALALLSPERIGARLIGFNPSGWFAILVVFVLAEVFREGARLRRDAELTI